MTAPRLLLVEDDPDLAGLLTELLTSEGYDVDTAGDGQRHHPPDQHVAELGVPLDRRALADPVLELLARGGAQRGEHHRGDRERERTPAGPGTERRPHRAQQHRQRRQGHDHHGGVHEQGMDRKPEDGVQHG